MVRVILSNHSHQPIVELKQAANVKWHNALNSIGYCEFDLALSDTYASPVYLNAGNYVHVYSDSADSTTFATADFGGQLANDFEIKPNEGVVSVRAAGLANLLNVSVVSQTTTYQNMTVAAIISDIIRNRTDNSPYLGLTTYTNAGSQMVTLYQINFGENVFNNVETLATTFNCDFEVRPNWSWASYDRQGVDNPNLVARYGNQGNVQVQATLHVLNSQLFNKVYVGSDSSPNIVTVVGQTSINQYGYFSEYISANTAAIPTNQDEQTMAAVELAKHEYPPVMLDGIVIVDTPLMPFGTFHLGDKVWFEAPGPKTTTQQVITPQQQTPTALTLYPSNAVASDLPTAQVLATTSTTYFNVNMSTTIGISLGYGELFSEGTTTAWPAFSAIGGPTGHGFLYDSAALESTQTVAGMWQQQVRLQCGVGLGVIGNITSRWFVFHQNANSYTQIGTTTLSQQIINSATNNYLLPAVSVGTITFYPGDKLYMDCWVNITTNSTGSTLAPINWAGIFHTGGVGGWGNATLTPGYRPVSIVNTILTPSLPMLQLFNGLQRILVMEYDDRKRTMTLTLGNALYKIIRGKLSEVRLYT